MQYNFQEDKWLTISEMARIHDISRQTLIYYDKIKLFCPERVDRNGYRYYSMLQIPMLKEICYLRSIGMGIDEIKEYNKSKNTNSTINLLEQQLEKIHEKIEELMEQERKIQQRVEVYHSAEDYALENYKPTIEWFPERKAIYCTWDQNDRNHHGAHIALMKIWNVAERSGVLPSKKWGAVIFKDDLYSEDPLKNAGGCTLLMDYNEEFPLDDESVRTVTFAEGTYICLCKYGMPFETSHIIKLMKWISNNGYEICGDIYDECLLDVIFYGREKEVDFCQLQIPVRKI